jgi:hypothetical protein
VNSSSCQAKEIANPYSPSNHHILLPLRLITIITAIHSSTHQHLSPSACEYI